MCVVGELDSVFVLFFMPVDFVVLFVFVLGFVFCGWDLAGLLFFWVGWLFSECFCLESLILAQDERWRRA